MLVKTKRIYDEVGRHDEVRILVDRLWPRGIKKADAKIDFWAKRVAPSNELRKWFNHDPTKWSEFRRRYFVELDANSEGVTELQCQMRGSVVLFLFGSKEHNLNNAVALKEYIEAQSEN